MNTSEHSKKGFDKVGTIQSILKATFHGDGRR